MMDVVMLGEGVMVVSVESFLSLFILVSDMGLWYFWSYLVLVSYLGLLYFSCCLISLTFDCDCKLFRFVFFGFDFF